MILVLCGHVPVSIFAATLDVQREEGQDDKQEVQIERHFFQMEVKSILWMSENTKCLCFVILLIQISEIYVKPCTEGV